MSITYFDLAIPFAVKDLVDSISVRELPEIPTLPHFSTLPNAPSRIPENAKPKVPEVTARIARRATSKQKTRRLR